MADVTMRRMLEAGVHFGHQTRFWNPKMAEFIFGERNKIHIINLEETVPRYKAAAEFVRRLVADGGTLLFVGSKRAAREAMATEAVRCGMPYVTQRWLGGMLTNFKTIRQSIKRLKSLEELTEPGAPVEFTKKEMLGFGREREKLERTLRNGDIVNIDVTVIKDGYHGDTSRMFMVGAPSIMADRLARVCFDAMWRGIRAIRPGSRLGDVGHAIQSYVEEQRFSVVREYCGHGIGRGFHEDPQVLHYGRPGTGVELVPGMTITVEPMVNAGKRDVKLLSDGWTVVTKDHSLSAQWEHTVLVTAAGFEVLTLSPAEAG